MFEFQGHSPELSHTFSQWPSRRRMTSAGRRSVELYGGEKDLKKNTVRRAARTSAIGLFTAALAVGAATGAFATDGSQKTASPTGPQIVSPSEYAGEGGKDPQSMAPIGEVAPAQGTSVQRLTDLLAETTGLELFQAPGVEKYQELGQTLTFSLGDGNYAHRPQRHPPDRKQTTFRRRSFFGRRRRRAQRPCPMEANC
ncbi:hypothetical protein SALBM311S_04887 [Streptomyces alboniger]